MAHIIFVIDESASTRKLRNVYIEGVNYLINTQKNLIPNSYFSMIKFNSKVNVLCSKNILSTLPEFTTEHYDPNGLTALYDAIGCSIELGSKNTLDKNEKCIVIILTDGQENYSSIFKKRDIRTLVESKKNKDWKFVFIAANQQASIVGKTLGIDNCVTYNESANSIYKAIDACNIAIGKAVYEWTGLINKYVDVDMPTDVRDVMESFGNFSL